MNNWIREAKAHWREHLPARFAALEKAGTLDKALREAAEQTYRETSELEASGLRPDEAWEMVREQYLFLPAEPEAEPAPTPWQQLRQDVATAQHHAQMALADPDYEVPEPPTAA
jgi:hypothetical protein